MNITRKNQPRILLGAAYSVIEPLGLLHLGGLARNLGYATAYELVKDHDYSDFFDRIDEFRPDIVGFNVYTGNHLPLFAAFEKLKKDHPTLTTIIGGPHATYFPAEGAQHADYVVMSEGFHGLRKILTEVPRKGIIPMSQIEDFPHPDRETFYAEHPVHRNSPIKSIITETGCPYQCCYCYNSSTVEDIKENMPAHEAQLIGSLSQRAGRLFPRNNRSIESVIKEAREIAEKWPTQVIYMQDDVLGSDITNGGFVEQLGLKWPQEVGLPFHGQMRWEMVKPKRLDMLQKAGLFGLTLAIESSIPTIRSEILNRGMADQIVFDGMREVVSRGLKVRTEQITGLPYGGTRIKTPMNLEADLHLLAYNIKLKAETGGPTMAWASTLAPYVGTKLGAYCKTNGHYYYLPEHVGNNDVPDTFFEASVLRFPKEWIGPSLKDKKDDSGVWLENQDLSAYRGQNAELRRKFNLFAEIPEGHLLAEQYLKSPEPYSYERLGQETQSHLSKLSLEGSDKATKMLNSIHTVRKTRDSLDAQPQKQSNLSREIKALIPCFASLPKGELAVTRAIGYAKEKGGGKLSPTLLADSIRHHLYDEVLYSVQK